MTESPQQKGQGMPLNIDIEDDEIPDCPLCGDAGWGDPAMTYQDTLTTGTHEGVHTQLIQSGGTTDGEYPTGDFKVTRRWTIITTIEPYERQPGDKLPLGMVKP